MKRYSKDTGIWKIGHVLLPLGLSALSMSACPGQATGGKHLNFRLHLLDGGATARVVGEVESNEKDCYVDGACFLVIRAPEKRVELYYSAIGDDDSCLNQRAFQDGEGVISGRWIEAYAAASSVGETLVALDTCPSTDFYIRPLEQPDDEP